MPRHITDTTQLKCDKGTATTPLVVTSQSFMKIEGKLQATEEDKQPNVNIKPFGVCSITRSSCSPAPIKWQDTSVFEIDGKKELLDNSTCQCSLGGKISVIKSAQSFVEEGGATIYVEDDGLDDNYTDKVGNNEKDEPTNSWVINWVPNQRGSFGIYRLAKFDNTQKGLNHWNIYAHGIMGGGFRIEYGNGNFIDIYRAQQIISAIKKISQTFETKLNSQEEISIKFVVCNERRNSSDEGLIKTIKKLTQLHSNITAEVSSGLVVVEYTDSSAELKGVWDKFATPDTEGRKGSYVTIKNGEIASTDHSVGLKPSTPEERQSNQESKEQQYDNPDDDYIDVNKEWKTKPKS